MTTGLPHTLSWREYFFSTNWRGKSYLLSPFLDFMMVGGGSIIGLFLLPFFVPSTNKASINNVDSLLFWCAFICNYPHFMMSYQLLYSGYRKKLNTFSGKPSMWWRYVNAGMIVPLLLLGLLCYVTYETAEHGHYLLLGYGLDAMFFFVGWHYMKQAFGMFIMLSAVRKVYYSLWQRRLLLWNSYAVWFFSWGYRYRWGSAKPNIQASNLAHILTPTPVQLPFWLSDLLLIAAVFSTLTVIVLLARIFFKEGKRTPFAAILGYFSMYYLFAIVNYVHPAWILIAPFFHSLQYIMFVVVYQRGNARKELYELTQGKTGDTVKEVRKIRGRFERFYAYSFILGLLSFAVIPLLMDAHILVNIKSLPTGFFMTGFLIFINIHHYFIDNVIWRKENSEVGEYLLKWSR